MMIIFGFGCEKEEENLNPKCDDHDHDGDIDDEESSQVEWIREIAREHNVMQWTVNTPLQYSLGEMFWRS